jgi:hypothetical protein
MSCFSPLRRACCLVLAAAVLVVTAPHSWSAPAEGGEDADQRDAQRQIDDMQQGLVRAQQQLVELLSAGPTSEEAKAMVQALRQEVASRMAEIEKLTQALAHMRQQAAEQQEQAVVAKLKEALDASRAQIAALNAQLAKQEQEHEEQPIDNAQLRIFRLKYLSAQDASFTVREIVSGPLRVSVDHRANALVVAGDEKSLQVIESLLQALDSSDVQAESAAAQGEPARSLLVRVFWLADGLAEGEGSEVGDYLPPAVIDAVDKLGVVNPRIVTQTANTISRDGNPDRSVEFNTTAPALVLKIPATLNVSGRVQPIRDNRAELDVSIEATGSTVGTGLKGSIVVPLGNYMVLGTANSVIPDLAAATGPVDLNGDGVIDIIPAGGMPGGPGGGRDGGFGGGRGGGGFGGPMGLAPGSYKTSRFVFVVQVVDAESYAAVK